MSLPTSKMYLTFTYHHTRPCFHAARRGVHLSDSRSRRRSRFAFTIYRVSCRKFITQRGQKQLGESTARFNSKWLWRRHVPREQLFNPLIHILLSGLCRSLTQFELRNAVRGVGRAEGGRRGRGKGENFPFQLQGYARARARFQRNVALWSRYQTEE